ncbi:unnamed protein product [Cuscuta campestris]|uniref:Rhodanese domain-containing protein n=1 Tax=Cuscuta campestris TaxID=132261 RepID=A0A484M7J0_9ASTE|nr:unnamed protein product [Cuscuta campestris]
MRCSAPLSLSRTLSPSPVPSSFASRVSRRLPLGFPGRAAAAAVSNWKCIRRACFCSAAPSPSPVPSGECDPPAETEDYVVVNFYRFVFVQDPQELLAQHISFMEGRDIHGRIYLNEQGINAQYSGPKKDALAYVDFVKEDQRFSDILVQTSPSLYGCHVFPRLKLRYKPSLVQVVGKISHLSLLDSAKRATPLTPSQWRIQLEAINNVNNLSNVDINRNCIILDVRNGYEWDIGHFQGAQRPNVDCFKSTSFGLSESEVLASDPLAGVDKDKTDILMYCTGGIRCDMYSTLLRIQANPICPDKCSCLHVFVKGKRGLNGYIP